MTTVATTSLAYALTDQSLSFDFSPTLTAIAPIAPIVHHVAQRSPEWFALRVGKLTGSLAYDAMPRRDGDLTTRGNLLWHLAWELATRRSHERRFDNTPMRRGRAQEDHARQAYAELTGATVHTSGFLQHPTLNAGTSLDGHTLDRHGRIEGVLEIKAPNTETHHHWRGLSRVIPAPHRAQITHHLWVSGAQWCDYVSYDDRSWLKPVYRVRVVRNEAHLAWYDGLVRALLAEVQTAATLAHFFQHGDLTLGREVLGFAQRALAARGGVTLRRVA